MYGNQRRDLGFMKDPATINCRIYVGNIAERVSTNHLEEHFRRCGKILGVALQRGFAFIQFDTEQAAKTAIKDEHGALLQGKKLNVKQAVENAVPRNKINQNRGNSTFNSSPTKGSTSNEPKANIDKNEKIQETSDGKGESGVQQNEVSSKPDTGKNETKTDEPSLKEERKENENPANLSDGTSEKESSGSKSVGAPTKENWSGPGGQQGSRYDSPGNRFTGSGKSGSGGRFDGPPGSRFDLSGQDGPNSRFDNIPGSGERFDGPPGGGGKFDSSGGRFDGSLGNAGSRFDGPPGSGGLNRRYDGPAGSGGRFDGPLGGPPGRFDGPMRQNWSGPGGIGGPSGPGNRFDGPPGKRFDGPPNRDGLEEKNKKRGGKNKKKQGFNDFGKKRRNDDFDHEINKKPSLMSSSYMPGPGAPTIQGSDRNDCEIIVVTKSLTEYAEYIEMRLKKLGLSVDLLFPNEDVPIGRVLANISSRGCLFAILLMPENEEHSSMTVNILFGIAQEHRNMLIEDGFNLIMKNFDAYIHGDKIIPPNIPSNSAAMSLIEKHPEAIQTLLNLLAENRQLTVLQYERVIKYLQERRELQVKHELGESVALESEENKETELQNRILNILNNKASAASNDALPTGVVSTPVGVPVLVPAPAVGVAAIPGRQPGSATAATGSTPLLNDPSVQKALDSLLQNDILKNVAGGTSSGPTFPAF